MSVTGYASEEQDRWVKKQMAKEQKTKEEKAIRDKAFLASPIKNIFLGSLKFKANYGRTDTSGFTAEGDATAQVSFDSEEYVWVTKFGYFNKPILKDIYLAGDQKRLDSYRRNKNEAIRWALFDAVKFNMQVGYGKSIKEEAGLDNYTTEEKSNYYIGISYELPLSKFGNEFIE